MLVHPLRTVLTGAARGRFPAADGSAEVVEPWLAGVEAVVSLTGRAYIATSYSADELARWHLDGFGSALDPRFVSWLAGPDGWCDCVDLLMVAAGTGTGAGHDALPRLDDLDDAHTGDRAAHARAVRSDVVLHGDERGSVTLASGIAGLAEIGVEVAEGRRSRGGGRALVRDALTLVPAGEPVLAAVAPGNAASVRAILAAGFSPIGSVQLVRPSR